MHRYTPVDPQNSVFEAFETYETQGDTGGQAVKRKPTFRANSDTSHIQASLLPQGHFDHHEEQPLPPSKPTRTNADIFTWLPELLALALSLACLCAMVVVLRYYDGRQIPELPHGKSTLA